MEDVVTRLLPYLRSPVEGLHTHGMEEMWSTIPGGRSDQLTPSLHLENDTPVEDVLSPPGAPILPWDPEDHQYCPPAPHQEYRDYLDRIGWGWVPKFLLMNLSTFMVEKNPIHNKVY